MQFLQDLQRYWLESSWSCPQWASPGIQASRKRCYRALHGEASLGQSHVQLKTAHLSKVHPGQILGECDDSHILDLHLVMDKKIKYPAASQPLLGEKGWSFFSYRDKRIIIHPRIPSLPAAAMTTAHCFQPCLKLGFISRDGGGARL